MKAKIFGNDERMAALWQLMLDDETKNEKEVFVAAPQTSVDAAFVKKEILPFDSVFFYGKIDKGALKLLDGYPHHCMLSDEIFADQNASLTAIATLNILSDFKISPSDAKILIIGFGRIGVHLSKILWGLGAKYDVASTSSARQARAFAHEVMSLGELDFSKYDVIINTAPVPIIAKPSATTLYIDLAGEFYKDINLMKNGSAYFGGLPAKYYPKSSAKLIYDFIKRSIK